MKHILQGLAIGAANVIPGLSGATVALLCGIFRPILLALKSFDTMALRLLFSGNFRKLAAHIQLSFLLPLFLGVGIGLVLFAKLFEFLFVAYPIFVWAFFFGLVFVSIFFVTKDIQQWSPSVIGTLFCGTVAAVALSMFPPALENATSWYLILCGVAALCSMILPGLSGSYVLILLGNYQLIVIQGIGQLQMAILLPFAIGAVLGVLTFSRLFSWLLQRLPNHSIALLCGFVIGSLRSLWPWKESTQNLYYWPRADHNLWLALAFMLLGAGCILSSEWIARKTKTK